MPQLKITYFNIQGPAEPARLALTIGGIEFEDKRVTGDEMRAMRAAGKLLGGGQVPQLEIDGQVLSQSEAIARYCARIAGLYPDDPLKAARVDEVIQLVNQDIRGRCIEPTMREPDAEKKKAMRKELADVKLPEKFALLEKLLSPAGYYVGNSVTLADLVTYVLCNWIGMEIIDGVPKEVVLNSPGLAKLVHKINSIPEVARWNEEKNAGKLPWFGPDAIKM